MSFVRANSYTINAGDTLYLIAKRELGNGDRWREIMKSNGIPFTDEEAKKLRAGEKIYIPKNRSVPQPSGSGFAKIVSRQTYEAMFPNRDPLYSYDSLVAATEKYPLFCNEGSEEQRKREAAAFLAHISHETTGGWESAPGGRFSWGLYFNYGAVGQALGSDLLDHPDLAKLDAAIAFETALWFWMTPQPPKPSCHAVITGGWTPSADDRSKGRVPSFGMTINIINGAMECGKPTPPQVEDRVGFYRHFCHILGVNVGDRVYCDRMTPY